MAIQAEQLRLVYYPDPVLRAKTQAIEQVTDEVQRVVRRMLVIMHEAPGVGLAASQVGLSWRVFVANPTGLEEDDRVFINPVLSRASREIVAQDEGCLSLPNVTAPVTRPKAISIEATGLDGKRFSMTSGDLAARVWQHEYDHLEGILIIHRMTEIDKMVNKKALRDLEQAFRNK